MLLAFSLDQMHLNLMKFGALDMVRNGLTFGFSGFVLSVLFEKDRSTRLTALILVPLFAQIYQTILGWDVGAGALSVFRWLPYLAMLVSLISSVRWRDLGLTATERIAVAAIFGMSLVGWVANADRTPIGVISFVLMGIVAPMFYVAVRQALVEFPCFRIRLLAVALIGFVSLALGTLVIIQVGSGLQLGGMTGILATRNVSDFNLVIGYLVLLAPFAIYASYRIGLWSTVLITLLFFATCFFGLSRVGMTLGPLMFFTCVAILFRRQPRQMLVGTVGLVLLGMGAWSVMPNREALAYSWLLRFNVTDVSNVGEILERVKPGGEDSLARDQLRAEAVRLVSDQPLTGLGFGGFGISSERGYNDAHSLSFTVLAEQGLLGLGILFAAIAVVFLRLWWLIRHEPESNSYAWVVLIAFAFWILVVHTVGGNLLNVAPSGFTVGAITSIMLAIYLNCDRWIPSRKEIVSS